MIETFYSSGTLDSSRGFLAALLIGAAFGFVLQRAGFSSSRRLSGVFYFRDMSVIKVMFTAVITAMLGLGVCLQLGWVGQDNIYLLPTVYVAQIVGGLIFGVGFVMGGWCPGTAAAGLAHGKIDAFIFLAGTIVGSIIFNELFGLIRPLYEGGTAGVLYVYDSLHLTRETFVVYFTIAGIFCLALCEYLDRMRTEILSETPNRILKAASIGFVILAVFLRWNAEPEKNVPSEDQTLLFENELLQKVDLAADHMEPEALANLLMAQEKNFLLVDIRPAFEYAQGHIPGAINISMENLHTELLPNKKIGAIILYSNGMTHPAQARDSLSRAGFNNVFILTDGLIGFQQRCLKPVSLRSGPVSAAEAEMIRRWRAFFSTHAAR